MARGDRSFGGSESQASVEISLAGRREVNQPKPVLKPLFRFFIANAASRSEAISSPIQLNLFILLSNNIQNLTL